MNWEPAHADHSIDHVSATFTFAETIDANDFDELAVVARKSAARLGLTHRVDLQEPIQVEVPSIQMEGLVEREILINLGGSEVRRRAAFQRVQDDGKVLEEFALGARTISLVTSRYERWAGFYDRARTLLSDLESQLPVLSRVASLRLQYVDRFRSIGDMADHFEVINRDSPFIAPAARDAIDAFHVHSGWFDFDEPGVKSLTNVNIGVADLPPTPAGVVRQATILCLYDHTSLTSQPLVDPIGRLQDMHLYLKNLFSRIISDEAAARVALNVTQNAT